MFQNFLLYIGSGTVVTIGVTLVALPMGTILGLVFALLHIYGGKIIGLIMTVYSTLMRGVPPIVLLFILYFIIAGSINISPFWAGAIALGIISSAYQQEIFRGAFLSVSVWSDDGSPRRRDVALDCDPPCIAAPGVAARHPALVERGLDCPEKLLARLRPWCARDLAPRPAAQCHHTAAFPGVRHSRRDLFHPGIYNQPAVGPCRETHPHPGPFMSTLGRLKL